MNTIELSKNFIVSSQIETYNLEELKNRGVKTIICNRPDNEEYNQTPFSAIKLEAEKLDIKAFHIPISPGCDPLEIRKEYDAIKSEIQEPILAYCKSGSRASSLYDLIQ